MTTRRRMRKVGAPPMAATPTATPAKAKPNVTPQAQGLYDQVMIAARRVLYGDPNDDSRFKMVLQRLAAGAKANLGVTIGQITAVVIANIQGSLQKAGKQVPSSILFHAGREVIADLVEIATAAGLMQKAQAPNITKAAMMAAVEAYKKAQGTMAAPPPAAGAQPATPPAAPPAPAAAPPQPAPPQGIINAARGVGP